GGRGEVDVEIAARPTLGPDRSLEPLHLDLDPDASELLLYLQRHLLPGLTGERIAQREHERLARACEDPLVVAPEPAGLRQESAGLHRIRARGGGGPGAGAGAP